MAERPSVKEILARVRAAGPVEPTKETTPEDHVAVPPSNEPTAPASPPAPPRPGPSASGRPMSLQEKLAAARDRPVGAKPNATPTPNEASEPESPPAKAKTAASQKPGPSASGRPMSLQEKLAAARDRQVEPVAPAPPPGEPVSAEPLNKPPVAAAETVAPAPGPTPETAGRPLTMKEKLAAARAGGGGARSAAAAKPAGAAEPTAKPATTARTLPPLEAMTDPRDIAEALRRAGAEREKQARAATTKVEPAERVSPGQVESKVVPTRSGHADAETGTAVETGSIGAATGLVQATRRWLMRTGFWIAAGLSAFVAMCARFLFPNILGKPPSTIKIGPPSSFKTGEVDETWTEKWGFWVVRSDVYDGQEKIYALSTTCTHLGCSPRWVADERKFKCPCHGSGFQISGVNFEGPAPRSLERYRVTIADDGQIVVDKSVKFLEELNQWANPESFIKV